VAAINAGVIQAIARRGYDRLQESGPSGGSERK
jgi:hypothetical protein